MNKEIIIKKHPDRDFKYGGKGKCTFLTTVEKNENTFLIVIYFTLFGIKTKKEYFAKALELYNKIMDKFLDSSLDEWMKEPAVKDSVEFYAVEENSPQVGYEMRYNIHMK